MGKRPGIKKTVGAWVTPEMQAAIDEWRRKHPGVSQSAFVLSSYAEKLRRDDIPIDDDKVFYDGRVRVPGTSSVPMRPKIDVHALTKKKLAEKKAHKQHV